MSLLVQIIQIMTVLADHISGLPTDIEVWWSEKRDHLIAMELVDTRLQELERNFDMKRIKIADIPDSTTLSVDDFPTRREIYEYTEQLEDLADMLKPIMVNYGYSTTNTLDGKQYIGLLLSRKIQEDIITFTHKGTEYLLSGGGDDVFYRDIGGSHAYFVKLVTNITVDEIDTLEYHIKGGDRKRSRINVHPGLDLIQLY